MSTDDAAPLALLDVADGVAVIQLNRPKMNVLDFALQGAMRDIAREVSERSDVAAVVVWGGERVLAAGADVKEMSTMSHREMTDAALRLQNAFNALAEIPKPTIAVVTGYALGGGLEVALACDLRIAEEGSKLGQPEILLGIIPGAGGTQRLPRLIGVSRAKDLIYTGRVIDAEEALGMGLVNRVVEKGTGLEAAKEMAKQFVGGPAMALRAAKEAIDGGISVDLDTGLRMERLAFSSLFATADRTAGMTSFNEQGPGKATFSGS